MFKWISSIQNAIKDARVNRKGPGRRRQDKLKSSGSTTTGRDTIDAISKHKTTPVDGLAFNTDRVEPISILHCEQKNRPRGPKGRRLPGRNGLHSTILNGSSTSDLLSDHHHHHHSSISGGGGVDDHLLAINESISLESSIEMTSESSANHHHHYHHQRRPRTTTTDTLDTDAGDGDGDDLDETGLKKESKEDEEAEEEETEYGKNQRHFDTVGEEPSIYRIISKMNKMRLEEEEEEETRKGKNLMILSGFGKGDNLSHEINLISKLNGDSNNYNNNSSRLPNGKTNGYPPPTTTTAAAIKSTTPSPMKRFHENYQQNFHQESNDLKRQLNAIFSNNNQQHHPNNHHHNHNHQQQQLTINLGESIVNIEQNKLISCLKEIYPALLTSTFLLDSSSSLSTSLNNFNPQLKELIKEIESLKDVKKSKILNAKIQGVIGKLVTLTNDYSKSIESFDSYNDQVNKLISSLSTLVGQSTATLPTTTEAILSTPSPSSLSPPSSPRLVNTKSSSKLQNGNKIVNCLSSSTHC